MTSDPVNEKPMPSGNVKPTVLEPGPTPAVDEPTNSTIYVYESSGITERHGRVPWWLWTTAVGLAIWGVYYLIHYWNEPGI